MIRVIIADDHTVVREGIRRILSDHADIKVVAESPDGAQVVRLVTSEKPDVLLLDLAMPGPGFMEILAVRRKPYLDAGGLEAADFRIAEDLAIFRLVFGQGYHAVAHASPETTVQMSPVPSVRHLLSQQRRWLKGGFEGPWYVAAGLVFTFGYHFIMSLLMIIGWFVAPGVTAGAWAVKWLSDTVMIGVEAERIQARGLRRMTPLLLFFTVPAFLWLPPSLLLIPNVRWMGEGYAVNYGRPRETSP